MLLAFGIAGENSLILPGRQTDEILEVVRKVALVGKSGQPRRIDRRHTSLEQLFGLPQPDVLQIPVG